MRFDADHLTARFGNMARSLTPSEVRIERQKAEMDAVAAVLRGDHYAWLTPSMFDPDAQRLRDKYPAAGTTRIKWRMDDETTLRVTGDMRTSDFEIGYTKNDHLSYAYGGVGDRYRKRHDGPTYSGKMSDMLNQTRSAQEQMERQIKAFREAGGTVAEFWNGVTVGRMSGGGPSAQMPRGVTLSPEGEAAPLTQGGDIEKIMTEMPQWKEPPEGTPRVSYFRDEHVSPSQAQLRAKTAEAVERAKAHPDYQASTLEDEIKADVERAAELAAKAPPGFMQYEEAKAKGLVDEDPWPTTEEILAAHAAKHYADGLREDAERDLARIEARNAFKVALRKSAITASLIMIGGVAACFAVGLIGALVYTAFNYFAPRMEGSDTASTTGFYLILALFGLMVGLLVGTSNRR